MRASGALVLLALGCSSQEYAWFPARTYVMDEIQGRGWYGGFQLRFEDDRTLVASPGCNGFYGSYRLSDGELVVEPLGSHDLGCYPVELLEQDAWMEDFLYAAPSYEIDGPKLILTDGEVEIEMVDEARVDPDRPLMGRDWWIRATISEHEIMVWDREYTATIYFDGDDTFDFRGACASGGGDYFVQGGVMSFRDVRIGPSQCDESQVASFVDAHLRRVLTDGSRTFGLDVAQIYIGTGNLGLVLQTK